MPKSTKELIEGMLSPDEGPTAVIKDPELVRELPRLDATIRFIEAHGRMPSTKAEFRSAGYDRPTSLVPDLVRRVE